MIKRKNSPSCVILSAAKNLILILAVAGYSINAQPFTKEEKEILQLQDTRTLGENKQLIKFLNSANNKTVYCSVFALSNIGDTNTVNNLYSTLLESNDNNVKLISAFALGQVFSSKSADYLRTFMAYISNETKNIDIALTVRILDAVSKAGSSNSLELIQDFTPYFENDSFRQAVALAIARFGMRKIKNDNSFRRLAEIMEQSTDSTVRKYAAYAFNRIGDRQALLNYNTELVTLSQSPEPYTKMWAFSAIGKQLDTSAASVNYMVESLEKESDWRVRVNICNALGNYKFDLNSPGLDNVTSALLRHAVSDESGHVSITAWQALGKLFAGVDTRNPLTRKIQQDIQFTLTPGKAIDWQLKAEAVKAYTKIFRDEIKDELLSLFLQTDNYDIKAAVVNSFGSMENGLVYKELRDSISNDVMRYNAKNPNKDGSMIGSPDLAKIYKAFVEALAELDNKLDEENRNNIRLIFSEFAASKNEAITDLCLTNLQDSIYLQYRSETAQVMTFDYPGFTYPKDKEVMLMYIQTWGNLKYEGVKDLLIGNLEHRDYDIAKASADALKNTTGKVYEGGITASKYRTDFDWKFIENLDNKKYTVIKTNRGSIKIELFKDTAPFTVQNFVKLSERGYYNNTIFHRVVPNFVIQGGDPTGTGYGGPGYSIRSEFSPLPFDAYTVGMASSGKDTEGSQFFITHCPTPHLDGKYTLFGRVVDGFDVVDKIQIGDVIESVSFSSTP